MQSAQAKTLHDHGKPCKPQHITTHTYPSLLPRWIDTSTLWHIAPRRTRGPSIHRQNHARHPPRLITRQKPHSSTHIPPIAFRLQQTPVLPRLASLSRHATSVHHWRVDHTRTHAIDPNGLRSVVDCHSAGHVLLQVSARDSPIIPGATA